MAILQLIAEEEKSLCFDFLEEKIRTVKDKDGKVLLDESGNAIVKTLTGTARIIRDSLPNASYIGFTGTPISREDRSTIEVFGDYIDVYDMTQAVLDGATRPVYVVMTESNKDPEEWRAFIGNKTRRQELAVEMLKKLIDDQVKVYKRTNLVKSEAFSVLIQQALNRYLNGMLTNEEVIQELLKLAKEMFRASEEGNKLGQKCV